MWKQVRNLRYLHKISARTYLSSSYQCSDAWNSRLNTPILQKINLDSYLFDLEQKYQQEGKFSSIDIDIFCNKSLQENHIDELFDILHRLRISEETTNTLDSTHHAVIRNLMSLEKYEELVQILNDPLNYGIFLDTFSTNLLLDTLMEGNKFTLAAKVSSFLMLQEDFGNDITKALCLLSCWKYLENPEPFEQPGEAPPVAEGKPKKKPEEVRIRVKYVRNPFFDDHFDLRDHLQIVGKTLYNLRLHLSPSLGRSIEILGLALYGKYEEGIKVISGLKGGEEIYSQVLEKSLEVLRAVEKPEEKEHLQEFIEAIEGKKANLKLIDGDFEQEVRRLLAEAVIKCEKEDISKQVQIYEKWCQDRQQKLDEELLRLRRAQAVKDIEKMTQEMEAEEQKLWFFENEDNLDLQIEKKKVYYPKRWFGKKKKPRVIDEGYVPPEVTTFRK
ncbi:hypothetical protein DMENIID0001_110610 [Sergentomyia squamirostris]